ncbi:MAG: hypothetical protein ACETV1_03570 [Candidatus Bathyarchaeia archaeon]
MKVETLGFYLENLLPGIVILSGILLLLPPLPADMQKLVAQLQTSEFLLSILFLTVAYLLGLISAMVSRFIVDNLSELFPRPLFLALSTRLPRHRQYDDLREALESLASKSSTGQPLMNEELSPMDERESRRILKRDVRIAWNRIYRSALAEVSRSGSERASAEVQRRREQGRLVRNLFFPMIISSIALLRVFQIQIATGWVITLACGMGVSSILLYAYAEYFTFAEASLQVKRKVP